MENSTAFDEFKTFCLENHFNVVIFFRVENLKIVDFRFKDFEKSNFLIEFSGIREKKIKNFYFSANLAINDTKDYKNLDFTQVSLTLRDLTSSQLLILIIRKKNFSPPVREIHLLEINQFKFLEKNLDEEKPQVSDGEENRDPEDSEFSNFKQNLLLLGQAWPLENRLHLELF